MAKLNSSDGSIDIIVVIDTEYVKKIYGPNKNPQTNPLPIDHNSEYMICTGANSSQGQGTWDLHFNANNGDEVSFRGISIYGNSEDAVIIYGITKNGGTNVFNTFESSTVTRSNAVQPTPGTPNGLPASTSKISFSSYRTQIAGPGTENFIIQFALYTLDDRHETQQLYGYYQFDPQITVS